MPNLSPIDEYLIAAFKRAGVKIDENSPIPRGDSLDPDVHEWLSTWEERAAILSDGYGPIIPCDSPEQEWNGKDENDENDEGEEDESEDGGENKEDDEGEDGVESGGEYDYRGRIRLGDSPKPYDVVEAHHPYKPDEPIMWRTAPCAFGWGMHGTVYCKRNWVIKESFVVECFEDKLMREANSVILTKILMDIVYSDTHPLFVI